RHGRSPPRRGSLPLEARRRADILGAPPCAFPRIQAVSDLTSLSGREAAARIAAGTLTAAALTRACLDHIAAGESVVGAWIHLDPERAIAEARQRDKESGGVLRGVPIGVKDVMDTHDMPTAYGSPIYRGHRPASDAACVALARGAGAVA